MATFTLDESHLRRLSPAARRELLAIMTHELAALRESFADATWNPEGTESYPLTPEEARLLLHGMPDEACEAMRVFARNFDGHEGRASFQELLEATGHTKIENVNKQLTWVLLHLRAVTGHSDAWLIGWRAKDWTWDEASQRYTEGSYYISGHATESLRAALDHA